MAQTIQIVPRFSFPYVETVINDYTVYDDTVTDYGISDPTVRYIFPFVSPKGIDNKFIRKRGRVNIVSAYGESNHKLYGQPLMQTLEVAKSPYAEIWCMRVMPENATAAHKVIDAYYLADDSGDASARKFRVKFTARAAGEDDDPIITEADLKAFAKKHVGTAAGTIYVDGEGYTEVPGVIRMHSAGRGKYGNAYRVRFSQNMNYEADYGVKFYTVEILSTEKGFVKTSTYVGGAVTSSKYNTATHINDILDDQAEGVVPVFVKTDEDAITDIFDAYIAWLTNLIPDLQDEYDAKYAEYAIPEGMMDGTINVTTEYADRVAELTAIQAKINYAVNATTVWDPDQFDLFFGRQVGSLEDDPFIAFPDKLDDSVDTSADDYAAADYTQSDIIDLSGLTGLRLESGSDGYFENPRTFQDVDPITGEVTTVQWTRDDEIAHCYLQAFSGEYDAKILSHVRIGVDALWDANYPFEVKNALVSLATLRNDSICYLDCGISSSFGVNALENIIKDYAVFNDFRVSKNIQQYVTREDSTKKRITVTMTYFLASQFANHLVINGGHIPFVRRYCQLSGHVAGSLYPCVEDYDSSLKERLVQNRFNYFEALAENVFQRAVQNTSQVQSSDLLEENNVITLFEIKRSVEADIRDRLYDFSDQNTRADFKAYEAAKFQGWGGKKVQSVDIEFSMNAFENQRSILHAYVAVVFRGLQKRAILEIDVNPRDMGDYSTSIATTGTSVVSYAY